MLQDKEDAIAKKKSKLDDIQIGIKNKQAEVEY